MAKTHARKTHSGSSGRTVGVYDRPPQKRNTRPMIIALAVALIIVLTLFFVRLSHSSPVEKVGRGGLLRVGVSDLCLPTGESRSPSAISSLVNAG